MAPLQNERVVARIKQVDVNSSFVDSLDFCFWCVYDAFDFPVKAEWYILQAPVGMSDFVGKLCFQPCGQPHL